jgi:hypothetical protein
MATTIPSVPNSASQYQTMFMNQAGLYSGAEKLIPISLANGQSLWITGLQWSGSLTTGAAARSTTSVHNIFSDILIQGNGILRALQPTIFDSTNTRYFMFDSASISNVHLARLDPVCALAHGNTMIISCRYSTTDFTDWTLPLGQLYAVFVNQNSTVSTNVTSVSQSYPMPVVTISSHTVYFGSSLLDLNDGYLYMTGQTLVSGNYNHYLARIPWAYIYDLTHTQYYSGGGWTQNTNNATPMLTNVGPEISLWRGAGKIFYVLAKMGSTNNTINLYSSSFIGQGYTVASVAATATSPPSGGWSNGAYFVPGVQLASGKRLGFYSNGIANDTYDKANPQFKVPRFFEF